MRKPEELSLDKVRRRLDAPHPTLGRLTWNEPWLGAYVKTGHGNVTVVMEVAHPDDVEELLAEAARIFVVSRT